MAAIDDLTTAQAQIAARIKEITSGANPTVTIGNRTVKKEEYLITLRKELRNITEDIQLLGGPWLLRSRGSV
jgi:hypothetical protein